MEKTPLKNDIQEAYCSFEVSKLLKEKGFDVPSPYWYNPQGIIIANMVEVDEDDKTITMQDILQHRPHVIEYKDCCFVPTHALAIEWIRVNFGIWIYINILTNVSDYNHKVVFSPAVVNGINLEMKFKCFDSPQAATEAALFYTLKNLIV